MVTSVSAAREKGIRSSFTQSLYQVKLALENYKADNGYYPTEGDHKDGGWQVYSCSNDTIPSMSGFYYPGWFFQNETCNSDGINVALSVPIDVQLNLPPDYTTTYQPPLIPKYISKFPEPIGDGNFMGFMGVPLGFTSPYNRIDGVTQIDIDGGNGDSKIYTCGGKTIKGYLIYFEDIQSSLRGTPSNYTLPRLTRISDGTVADPYAYCLTAD